MNAQQKLKQYALLVRLPNIFTSITNVLVGYFSVVGVTDSVASQIGLLCGSSALLYASGIVFNDYFDLKVDLLERPSRPLPSGAISARNALALGIGTMITANVLAFLASPTSLVFSLVLSGIILAYDKKAKWTFLGPFTMGLARYSNVFLGASAGIATRLSQPASASDAYIYTLFPATAVFCYVYSITLLSRHEAEAPIGPANLISTNKVQRIAFLIICMDVAAMGVYFAAIGKPLALFITGILAFIVWNAWQASRKQAPRGKGIQQAIKVLVLSIIVIDSAFIAAYAGIFYGLATLLLLPVPIALSKKLYVT